MNIDERRVNDLLILDITGKITIGSGDVHLREAVQTAMGSGAPNILLNLGAVTGIDSSGVGEIVAAHTSARNRGGRLALVNLPAKVLGVLQVQLLPKILEIYDNEDEALDALEP